MKRLYYLILITSILSACHPDQKQAIKEIKQTEKDFEKMVAEKGITEAFYYYAADSAVKDFGDTLIIGKDNIHEFYKNQAKRKITLNWTPDYVYASESGDLGYSYGKYTYHSIDSVGQELKSVGYFHTVWRRQGLGKWRFVWD
jgi:ketosteroid isomerase-like protein